MVIKAIETACYLLKDVPGSSSTEINSAYYESCSQIVNNLDPNCFKIEKSVIEQAINLANYSAMMKKFSNQKKKMSNFQVQCYLKHQKWLL